MIQLLSTVVIAEGIVAFLLMINIPPFRKLLMKALDKALSNKGPSMIATLAAAMGVILASSIFSITKIQARAFHLGTITPTDQILLKTHMLEASLMGYSLFLGLVIYRLHHFLQKIRGLKKDVESLKTKVKESIMPMEETKPKNALPVTLKNEVTKLKEKAQELNFDCQSIETKVKSAEGDAKAIQKQTDLLLMEFNKILEENERLHSQLAASSPLPKGNKEKDV
eukprot:TRINITY_DN9016_c0_g1_i1.p1 TRINITY_DN9016_c0_g1~~TRINITY_DN9016_c0_g1_i1.p1  ORF type:complete len:225 (-),score=38.27 TRINITY_DN9016_c0_g1_i1:33-707(-)